MSPVATRSMLDHALAASDRGWAVVLGKDGGNTPAATGWQDQATTDRERIVLTWRYRPKGNVLVATGRVSDLVVIDLDRKKGKDGVAVLDKFLAEKSAELPGIYMVLTPTGGVHLYFRYPPGFEGRIGNSVNLAGMQGVDVRADGGYVVAAGSVRADGGYTCPDPDAEIAELPPVLLELLTAGRVESTGAPAPSVTAWKGTGKEADLLLSTRSSSTAATMLPR